MSERSPAPALLRAQAHARICTASLATYATIQSCGCQQTTGGPMRLPIPRAQDHRPNQPPRVPSNEAPLRGQIHTHAQ
eukprot:8886966-Alexandrium_andersonii.AAC.1